MPLLITILTGESYYFVFEKWFAVEKEDGKLEREVMAADGGLGFVKVNMCIVYIYIHILLNWSYFYTSKLRVQTNYSLYSSLIGSYMFRYFHGVLQITKHDATLLACI